MGKMNVILSDSLKGRFREPVRGRKGANKGDISEAFIEAVELWLRTKMPS